MGWASFNHMARLLTIHGDGDHGRVATSTALLLGWQVHMTDAKRHTEPAEGSPAHIAIGDNRSRKNYDMFDLVTLIHPSAYVDASARLGAGVFAGPMAVVHVGAKVGRGAIINSGAVVEHDCDVGAWTHISPGAILTGKVTVGEGTWIGAGAVVKHGITICPWCIVGCGAVVVKDITESGTYVGCPAQKQH